MRVGQSDDSLPCLLKPSWEDQLEDHLVVYCQSGHRSNIAAETLTDLDYRHVYNVTGSMNAWLAAGFPVESGRR
jgi:phage shock protein E